MGPSLMVGQRPISLLVQTGVAIFCRRVFFPLYQPGIKRTRGWFEKSGDILQYAFPTVVGLADLIPDIKIGQYGQAMRNLSIILTLIAVQNRGTLFLKRISKKPRPSFPNDLESFPSGHMMIAMQCLTRVFFAYTHWLPRTGAIATTSCIALGRYLPGKHDIVDLTVGGILGVGLGCLWNRTL